MNFFAEQIVQDILRIESALKLIVKYGGDVVPGLADRNGHRRRRAIEGERQRNHPLKGKKFEDFKPSIRSFDQLGIHPVVESVLDELLLTESVKFDRKNIDRN